MFVVHFTVTVPSRLREADRVFVAGSDAQLGHWDPQRALALAENSQGQWTGTITVSQPVSFRYFVGHHLQSEADKPPTLVICRWETHFTPRHVLPEVEASKTKVCRSNVNDIFGFNGGREKVTDGWILNAEQNQIILTLSGSALKFYKSRHIQQQYRLKIVPIDLRNKDELPDEEGDGEEEAPPPTLPSHSTTEIAPLTHESPQYREQDALGELFHNGQDYWMYRTQSVAVEYLSFRIEVYSAVNTSAEPMAVGYALPSTLMDTYGKASLPLLTPKGVPVGKIYLMYLFVRPLRAPHPPQDMSVSYSRHWKKRTTLEVGHRGMGNSYTKCAVARENTLHSLNSAATRGADFVEFDVHLTKDMVPVIFHDFHVMVAVAKRSPSIAEESAHKLSDAGANGNGSAPSTPPGEDGNGKSALDFYQLAVKDLRLGQLRLLHLEHVAAIQAASGVCVVHDSGENLHTKVTGRHDEAEDHRPFPTLAEAFNKVSSDVGFNVEVKYPMLQADGVHECDGYYERNAFVDTVLADVLDHAGSRRVVFSSFDPDICTMIALKQNKYGVLFLCLGESTRHTAFVDERTKTSTTAVNFAYGMGLLGVNFNSEDVLHHPEPIIAAKRFGMIVFVWGDELADKKNVDYFKKQLLVDGLIYDRIGETESRSNVFSLEKQMKAVLFGKKVPSPVAPPLYSSSTQLKFGNSDEGPAEGGRGRGNSSEWPQQRSLAEDYRIRRHHSTTHGISHNGGSSNGDGAFSSEV